MATITQQLCIYFRPSKVGSKCEYTFNEHDDWEDDDYILVGSIDISFENNIDTRQAQIDLIDKAIEKLDSDHYTKKMQLETRRSELLAIGCDVKPAAKQNSYDIDSFDEIPF